VAAGETLRRLDLGIRKRITLYMSNSHDFCCHRENAQSIRFKVRHTTKRQQSSDETKHHNVDPETASDFGTERSFQRSLLNFGSRAMHKHTNSPRGRIAIVLLNFPSKKERRFGKAQKIKGRRGGLAKRRS